MPRKYIYKKDVPGCSAESCDRANDWGGFCSKHYAQEYRYGGIKRSIKDRNSIRTVGKTSYISLYNLLNEVVAEAVIDTADVELVRNVKWHVHGPFKHVRSQSTGLHNLLLGCSPVDHINNNPLDNRRANLRPATNTENTRNNSRHANKKSCEYKGVFFDNMTKKKWKASICSKTIGRYETKEEAAWMYDQYALGLYAEFAKTNFEYF